MNIDSSISSIYASSYASSIYNFGSYTQDTSTVSTTNFASSGTTLEISSQAQMMSRVNAKEAPDFDSMSTEDFREHLLDVRSTMEADGLDTSSMQDIENMTDLELESLKNEMAESKPKPPEGGRPEGPPPPPPGERTGATSSETDSLVALLEAMKEASEEEEVSIFDALTNDEEEEELTTTNFLTN